MDPYDKFVETCLQKFEEEGGDLSKMNDARFKRQCQRRWDNFSDETKLAWGKSLEESTESEKAELMDQTFTVAEIEENSDEILHSGDEYDGDKEPDDLTDNEDPEMDDESATFEVETSYNSSADEKVQLSEKNVSEEEPDSTVGYKDEADSTVGDEDLKMEVDDNKSTKRVRASKADSAKSNVGDEEPLKKQGRLKKDVGKAKKVTETKKKTADDGKPSKAARTTRAKKPVIDKQVDEESDGSKDQPEPEGTSKRNLKKAKEVKGKDAPKRAVGRRGQAKQVKDEDVEEGVEEKEDQEVPPKKATAKVRFCKVATNKTKASKTSKKDNPAVESKPKRGSKSKQLLFEDQEELTLPTMAEDEEPQPKESKAKSKKGAKPKDNNPDDDDIEISVKEKPAVSKSKRVLRAKKVTKAAADNEPDSTEDEDDKGDEEKADVAKSKAKKGERVDVKPTRSSSRKKADGDQADNDGNAKPVKGQPKGRKTKKEDAAVAPAKKAATASKGRGKAKK